MTPILRRRGRIQPADALPPRKPAHRQCACPVEHGTHVPGQCGHTVDDGPVTTGCPCGTRPDSHQTVGGQP